MNVGLFEDAGYVNLLPLTWLRACFELRCGVDHLIDKVRAHAGGPLARLWVREALREAVRDRHRLDAPDQDESWLWLNARAHVKGTLAAPPVGTSWRRNGTVLVAHLSPADAAELGPEICLVDGALDAWLEARQYRSTAPPDTISLVQYPWDLPLGNGDELRRQCGPGGVHEGRIYAGAHLLNPGAIHVARGATIKPGAVLDAESGPIHVDAGAVIQPNAVVEGPAYIGPRSQIWPGATIRNASIGPVCKVGGEIEASIVHGYSNLQHGGFLGHSYIAEWVNLGAGTITSDLKNTYGTIRVYLNGVGVESGQHFIGSIIGDHAKTGIGTILPTGCVVGLAANIFTQTAIPKFVPSFAWLTDTGMTNYRLEKALDIAQIVMARREIELTRAERKLIEHAAAQAREVEIAGWA